MNTSLLLRLKSCSKTALRNLVIACLALAASIPAGAQPVPPTNNTSAPYLGFYEWGLLSSNNPCQSRFKWMDTWLNRTNPWLLDFTGYDNWADLQTNVYLLESAKEYLRDNPGATFVLTVGMLPGSGGTPQSGTSLATGATGAYNTYFSNIAQSLVTYGIANRTVIRLGHEFNGNWYPWQVPSQAQAVNYANYWIQVVTAMHGVPGASGIKFFWCAANAWTGYGLAAAYPGNAYVDYIGCDIYDSCYAQNTYPYPANDSPADMLQRQKNAWASQSGTNNNGLAWFENFAKTNGKPMAIGEWGMWALGGDGRGGGDDTYFVQQMYNFIQTPSNNVAFSIYFDVGLNQISQAPTEPPSVFPTGRALFQQLFAVPPFAVNNDIGTTGLAGGCTAFAATGAGNGFLAGGTSDNFHFASQAISGNTVCLAQITSMSTSTGQSGLMIRQTMAANDPYAALFVSNGQLIFQSRTTAGAAATQNSVISSVTAPVWLKMLRTGNVITGYTSTDGLNWIYAGGQTVAMNSSAYAGVAVGSGSTSVLNTTGLANVNNLDIAASYFNTATSKENSVTPAIASAIFLGTSSTTGVTKTGSWYLQTPLVSQYGGAILTSYTPTTASTATLTPTLPTTGQYDVYAAAPGNWQDGDQCPVTITSASGTTALTFNNQSNDGLWVYQGTYNFNAGTSGKWTLANTNSPGGEGYVTVNAVMFVPVPTATVTGLPPVPTGLTATAGNAQVSLTWTAAFGATGYNVLRSTTSNGTYSIISTNQSSTSFVNTGLTNGTTYYYEVNAVNSSGTSANSSPVSATPSGGSSSLPAGQTDVDIGGSLPAGTGNDSGGVYTLTGGGANVWGTSDQFNYAYQSGGGDETIITRVTGLSGAGLNASAKAGIMFRDSTATGAIFVDVDYIPSSTGVGRVEFLYRPTTGASATSLPGVNVNVAPLSPNAPVWIKLVKSGTTFTGYYSTSVTTPAWNLIGSTTVSLTNNSNYLTGLDVCSLNNGTPVTGTFDNVSMLPTGQTDIDIGGPSPAGTASYASGTGVYTVTAGGANIYNTSDQYNYLNQSGSGDQTLIARVTGLSGTNLNQYAKAGVEFRDSTAANAIDVKVDYEPGTVNFTYRSATGASTVLVAYPTVSVTPSPTTPVWVKLVKSGTSYSAFYSTSVSTPTWTQVGSTTTVTLTNNNSYLEGLCTCSHNNGTAVTATYDNVGF